jgi:hypothetical protein
LNTPTIDAKFDGEQLRYCGPTPDFEVNDVKISSKVRVVFSAIVFTYNIKKKKKKNLRPIFYEKKYAKINK